MIKSVRLENFFSFKNQITGFSPTGFLIGVNGAGKSNVIKVFRLLKATVVEGALEELIISR